MYWEYMAHVLMPEYALAMTQAISCRPQIAEQTGFQQSDRGTRRAAFQAQCFRLDDGKNIFSLIFVNMFGKYINFATMKESAKKSDRSWRYVGWHLVAMAAVCLLLFLGVKYGLNMYTHHGEAIPVPDVKNKPADEAKKALAALELIPVVTDTGYVKKLPPGCVLEQMPAAGSRVKSGHTVRLVLNAKSAPLLKLPDVIDNSSLRTAMSRLSAMGFKMGMPEFIPGEKDWVLGVKADGKPVATGDKISTDATIVVQVGNGMISADDSITYVDPVIEDDDEDVYEYGDVDPFVEVDGPPAEEKKEGQ